MSGMGGFWDVMGKIADVAGRVFRPAGGTQYPTNYPARWPSTSPVPSVPSGGTYQAGAGISTNTLLLLGAGAVLLMVMKGRR